MSNERAFDVITGNRLGRRSLLRGSLLGGAGIAAAALIGCGGGAGDGAPEADSAATSAASSAGAGTGPGELVQDPDLPYPYNFPDRTNTNKPGGTMVMAHTFDVQNIDPTVSASGGTVTVPNMVYNRFLGIDRGPDADVFDAPVLEPELAASWERSPDGLTFTFKVDSNARWQNLPPLNGRAFVASDAAFAMNRYASEGVHQSYYVNVDSIDAIDDNTLKITMKRPVVDFLNPLGSNKQTIFPRELVDDGTITKRGIGTGPMILKEMAPASHVTFDTNRDYWEQAVLIDGFEFKIMPDHSSRLAAFRAGQVDFAYALGETLSEVETLLGTNPDIQINMHPSVASTAFAMNLANPKFQDERLRQGLSLAIDRNAIIQIVFEGLGRTGDTIPWTFLFDEQPTIESGLLGPWVRYDPAEGRQLLEAAGASDLTMHNVYFAYSESLGKMGANPC